MPVESGFLLPFRFDPVRLRADLARVSPAEWSPHYNDAGFGGIWLGAALRSASGRVDDLSAQHATAGSFSSTPLLERCSYFREVLDLFQCPLAAARLLALAPGSFIREHTDSALDFEDGEIRIHIPIETNPDVEFCVSGERLLLEEGLSYYINVNLPHRVANRGHSSRIHLVLDAGVNAWVSDLFQRARQDGSRIPRCAASGRGYEAFCEWTAGRPEVCRELHALPDRGALAARAHSLGSEAGFQFVESEVAPVRIKSAAMDSAALLEGWTPAKVTFRGREPVAECVYTGKRRFREPFFEDSLREARRNPFSSIFRREILLEAAQSIPALEPAGFIFHMSRCGSTLTSQMLAALDRAVVVSEPHPLDDVLQAGFTLTDLPRERHLTWLRTIVRCLGQPRSGRESLYLVKLDSWHIHYLPLIRQAFPGVPWVFLRRRLDEAVQSQLRRPGLPGLPGALDPRLVGLGPEDVTRLDREQWSRRVLTGFVEAAETYRGDAHGLFVDYDELPEAVWTRIAPHFGVSLTAGDVARMCDVARFDAKNPGKLFEKVPAPEADSAAAGMQFCGGGGGR